MSRRLAAVTWKGRLVDWSTFIGPAVIAAAVSGIVSIVSMMMGRSTTIELHRQRLDADQILASRRMEADIALAERRFQLDLDIALRKRQLELAEAVLVDFYGLPALVRS